MKKKEVGFDTTKNEPSKVCRYQSIPTVISLAPEDNSASGEERDRAARRIQAAFRGHMVCLIDADTASDGEAFAEGFRRLGLGKVLGMRSWGGEVSGVNA